MTRLICWTDLPLTGRSVASLHLLYRDTLNIDDLAQLTELNQLTESWRLLARRRLEYRAVEKWSRRLNTPPFEGAALRRSFESS